MYQMFKYLGIFISYETLDIFMILYISDSAISQIQSSFADASPITLPDTMLSSIAANTCVH